MHTRTLHKWQHRHDFYIVDAHSERNSLLVILLTVTMMAVEIAAGLIFNSMALLADGWHMGTHAGAIGITFFAYRYARRHADDPGYCFGTGKVGVLGGYTSAIILAMVALLMAGESAQRFFNPRPIRFNEAIIVAGVGLVVNLVSAFILKSSGHHHEDHNHNHDHNLTAAYLHVIADALTSVLAIIALLFGKHFGWIWMDPAMGIVGAVVISRWAYLLIRDTSTILLDNTSDTELSGAIMEVIENDSDNIISDMHLWQISSNKIAAVIALVTHYPKSPAYYKGLLENFKELDHVTVEVNHADGEPCRKIK